MKKFVKGILIVSLLLLLTGTGCLIAGCIMGITSDDLIKILDKKPFIDFENEILISQDEYDYWDRENEHHSTSHHESYKKEDIKRIHLDIAAANCNILVSDNQQIIVKASDRNNIKATLKNGNLRIERETQIFDKHHCDIDIYLPKDMILDVFDFESAAGNVRIESPICAEQFTMQAGASKIQAIGSIKADIVDIEVGAGMIHLNQLDSEKVQIETGAGQTVIGLCGQKDQYNVKIESAAGKVQFGDEAHEGVAKIYENHPKDAHRHIQIESALGEVIINFEEGN